MDTHLDPEQSPAQPLTAAEIGALAHLYRGEVYRSTIWRTRLDNTTNWSVVTMGIALSITFASSTSSPLPLILVGVLIFAFLVFEARRYRYFNVWRARARWMETHFYAPMLRGEGISPLDNWQQVLAKDYCEPRHHISFLTAMGRRLRHNYAWILAIQATAYAGKIISHPEPLQSLNELWQRTAVGPIPGQLIVVLGVLFYGGLAAVGIGTYYLDRAKHGGGGRRVAMG